MKKIQLKPHWATRAIQLQADNQQLSNSAAVVRYLSVQQEWLSLTHCLMLDAGLNPRDFLNASLERDGDSIELVLNERSTQAAAAADLNHGNHSMTGPADPSAGSVAMKVMQGRRRFEAEEVVKVSANTAQN